MRVGHSLRVQSIAAALRLRQSALTPVPAVVSTTELCRKQFRGIDEWDRFFPEAQLRDRESSL